MDTKTRPQPGEDTIYLKDILRELWQQKILVLSFTAVCLIGIGIALLVVPKRYTASIVINPVAETSNTQSGVLGSLTSRLSTIAGLSTPSDSKKVESVAILQSGALTERYLEQNDLLPMLFPKLWDASRSKWKTTDPEKTPTLWKGNEFFRKNIRTVTTEGKSGLVTLTITWRDPRQAAAWANGLVKLANEYERDTAITTSEQNIAYLTSQAASTDVLGIKEVIYSLLQSEFDKAMLAKGNREFAFKIIDPARVPERPSYPDKVVWILVTLFSSLSVSILLAFFRVSWRRAQAG